MTIKLYINTSENNTPNKNLTSQLILNGNLQDENVDITKPTILISGDESLLMYNYTYIPSFNRYYFVNGKPILRNGLYYFNMKCDVLKTYWGYVRNLSCIIEKQESAIYSSLDFNDGSYKFKENQYIETINFANGFNENGEFILLTAGKVGSL